MEDASSLRDEVQSQIRAAFQGVRLGSGVSLKQAQAIDRFCEGLSDDEFARLPRTEITDDWAAVPLGELERDCCAHLDAEGFRYYIPALMLSVLTRYDNSMRVIGVIRALYAKRDAWEYHMKRYALLTDQQKAAIAFFLSSLPTLVPLDREDLVVVQRSLHSYWSQFHPSGAV